MLLHVRVIFMIDDLKESDFYCFLHIWNQLIPNVGVRSWGKVGKAKSELRSSEISRFIRV